MKYDSATIEAHAGGGPISTFDLEGLTLSDLYAQLREAFGDVDADEDGDADPDEAPSNVTFTNPQGFAVHLFRAITLRKEAFEAIPDFDELLEAWSAETDSDRREAMGEYLDDMGADDLSDFDEAYQGQYSSGAEFAEQFADDIGAVDEKNASWIEIDWEATWERSLRHDYHITDSGHVFRNL